MKLCETSVLECCAGTGALSGHDGSGAHGVPWHACHTACSLYTLSTFECFAVLLTEPTLAAMVACSSAAGVACYQTAGFELFITAVVAAR